MTFEQNEADREPPELGGFSIANCRLPIADCQFIWRFSMPEIGNRQLAIGNLRQWIR
jgi:hypothetical protein